MIVIAHLSNTHLDGGPRNSDRAARVINYLNDLPHPIDAVLVTGDIADHGMDAEYEEASKLFVSAHPVLVCPGNHDARATFRKVLLGETGDAAPINPGAPHGRRRLRALRFDDLRPGRRAPCR